MYSKIEGDIREIRGHEWDEGEVGIGGQRTGSMAECPARRRDSPLV